MQIPIFSLNKINIKDGPQLILKINNFDIHRGAAYFIHGNMGAGKTTLMNLITKKTSLESGKILYEDSNLSNISNAEFQKDISYVEQNFKFPWLSSTVENYMIKHLSKYKHLKNVSGNINTISRQMDIKHLLDVKLTKLTPGQLRWIMLAMNIAADTKVLIIDEIEQHLGAYHIKILNKILYRKCSYDGVTLIASTQNKAFFQSHLASVVMTLENGKIFSVRSPNRKHQSSK